MNSPETQSRHSVQRLVRRCDIGLVTRLVREIDHVATGALMRQGRLKAKISLREMARRLEYSAPFVSDLELGRRNWTKELEAKYAAILCPPNDKLTDAAPPSGIETKTDATGRRSRAATC